MLLQIQVITQKPDISVNLVNQNSAIIFQKASSTKFQGEVIIHNDEKIQYIVDNTIVQVGEIKFEKNSFYIMHTNILNGNLQIVKGIKEITFILLGKSTKYPFVPFVCGSIPQLGNWNPQNAQMMILDGDKWSLTIQASTSFEYKFILNKILGNDVQWESTPNRIYDILTSPECLEIESLWERQAKFKKLKRNPKFVHITIHYKTTCQRDKLLIVGNTAQLGFWNPQHGKAMQRYLDFNWNVGLIIDENEIEFKFVLVTGDNCVWEEGENRKLELEDRQQLSIMAYWNFQNNSRIHSREYDLDCPICSYHLKDQTIRIGQLCGHLMCSKCYLQMQGYLRVKCPICRKPFQL